MTRAARPAPARPAGNIPRAPRPRATTLANGLRVLLAPMPRTGLVSVWCWYRVGSKDERPGVTGISHWAEHMNFKGTRRYGRDEITRRVELAGGLWNGYTWLDVTTYFETVQASAFDEMLRIEASRMTECLYEKKEVERERTVVISELQGGENDPRTYLEREVSGTAIQAHPYRWPTIGYLSDLRAITREDLFRHYRAYYVPNNAILVASGDFTEAQGMALVRRHFGKLKRGAEIPVVRTLEPDQSGERRVSLTRPSGASYLHIAWPAPAAADPLFATLLVVDGLLAGGPSVNSWSGAGRPPSKASRLYRALIDGGLAADFGTQEIPTRHPYLYTVQATAREGVDLGRLEAAALGEIEAIAAGRFTAGDLTRAKEQFFARYALESESVTDLAHQLGFFETIGGHRIWLDLPRRVAAVTADDAARFAAGHLDEKHRTVGWLRP